MMLMMYSAVVVETNSDVMFEYHIKDKVPFYRSTVYMNVSKIINPKILCSSKK